MDIVKEQADQSDNSEDIESISGEEAQRIARSKDEELIATQIFWALRDVREHLAKSGYVKEMGKDCLPKVRADFLIRDYLQNVLVNADLDGFCTSLVKLLMPDGDPNFSKPHLAILGNESFMEDTKKERLGQYIMSTFRDSYASLWEVGLEEIRLSSARETRRLSDSGSRSNCHCCPV